MRHLFKWLGFALVATGIAVFPFAIWFPGPWGVLSLVAVMAGCIVLVLVTRSLREPAGEGERDSG